MYEFEGEHFAIIPEWIDTVINERVAISIADDVDIKSTIEAAKNKVATKFKGVSGDIAVLPVHGYISHRATIWAAMGFEASSEMLAGWVRAAVNDNSIGAIVLDINSPGGTVFGLSSAGDVIFNARGKKPIIAVANSLMASAAYFLGSAADEIVADPDALTGSIGTIAVHLDYSQMLANEGIKPTIIQAGDHKSEGSPYVPLDETAKAAMQKMIDDYYSVFVSAVARNRDTSAADVRANFGQGRVLRSNEAKAVGMINRIASMTQILDRLSGQKQQSPARSSRQAQNKMVLNRHRHAAAAMNVL